MESFWDGILSLFKNYSNRSITTVIFENPKILGTVPTYNIVTKCQLLTLVLWANGANFPRSSLKQVCLINVYKQGANFQTS